MDSVRVNEFQEGLVRIVYCRSNDRTSEHLPGPSSTESLRSRERWPVERILLASWTEAFGRERGPVPGGPKP